MLPAYTTFSANDPLFARIDINRLIERLEPDDAAFARAMFEENDGQRIDIDERVYNYKKAVVVHRLACLAQKDIARKCEKCMERVPANGYGWREWSNGGMCLTCEPDCAKWKRSQTQQWSEAVQRGEQRTCRGCHVRMPRTAFAVNDGYTCLQCRSAKAKEGWPSCATCSKQTSKTYGAGETCFACQQHAEAVERHVERKGALALRKAELVTRLRTQRESERSLAFNERESRAEGQAQRDAERARRVAEKQTARSIRAVARAQRRTPPKPRQSEERAEKQAEKQAERARRVAERKTQRETERAMSQLQRDAIREQKGLERDAIREQKGLERERNTRCGTRARYRRGCRCDPCRAANTAYKKRPRTIDPENCGSAYNYRCGCRCERCRAAYRDVARVYQRERRKRGERDTNKCPSLYNYQNGCRCALCRDLQATKSQAWRNKAKLIDVARCGSRANFARGCRCKECVKASSDYHRGRYAKKAA